MTAEKSTFLDRNLRVRLSDLDAQKFEDLFLLFLKSRISLTVERHGKQITRRIISAEKYAPGSGRDQKGIDLRAEVEGEDGKEVWVFQCKRHKSWNRSQTLKAIKEAGQYPAQHYFLIVACDPHEQVQDEIHKHANWTFWNLDQICAELRLRLKPSDLPRVLFFLPPEELKRFAPFTTDALISPGKFFERFLGSGTFFRHDWRLVGRDRELQGLRDFMLGPHKVQILTARGGEGKSRLLRELCRTLSKEEPETEVVFLNPHRGDDLALGFVGDTPRRVVLVDDAHRAEQVPMALLDLVRRDPVAKIVLATRPQGIESLSAKLCETGLGDQMAAPLTLASLKRGDVKALATEVLGEPLARHAGALAKLTGDNPFLTVMAGGLLRLGRLEWGKWENHDSFGQMVFREFEQENLEAIPEPDRAFASGLVRMLALLAPQAPDSCFSERAARVLGCSVFQLETQLNRLRQTQIVAGGEDGLRIVPDLFADFLVYDACYGPKKTPGFVGDVLREFNDRGPVLLRNLSEATWLARIHGVGDDTLLNAALEPALKRFTAATYFERALTLQQWAGFGVFLPGEALRLARLAVELERAPEDETERLFFPQHRPNSYQHVCEEIPPLLAPIVIRHSRFRHEALDLLWSLGLRPGWEEMPGRSDNHPWAAIARILKYETHHSIQVMVAVLDWLKDLFRRPEALLVLESRTPILRLLLSPCFERFVNFTQLEGRKCRPRRQSVDLKATRPVRDRAFTLIESVIDSDSALAVLDALSALEAAIRRVTPWEAKQGPDPAVFRARWRPDRLRALSLYEKAAGRHAAVAVRYEIRRTLLQTMAYDEDAVFVEECRRVLATVPEDLALQTAVALLSQGAAQLDEVSGRLSELDTVERQHELWQERILSVCSRLAAAYPEAGSLSRFLAALTAELTGAGNHIDLGSLFAGLAEVSPPLASALAEHILAVGSGVPLTQFWPALVEKNQEVSESRRTELFTVAVRCQIPEASGAVIQALLRRARDGAALCEREGALLLELAGRAEVDEAARLLQFVEWSNDANIDWSIAILESLPLRKLLSSQEAAARLLPHLLAALVPYRQRRSPMPRSTMQHVLKQLVSIPELDLDRQTREWNILVNENPREVYHLVRERIAFRASLPDSTRYRPVPHGYPAGFDLSALAKEADYPGICDELWNRVSDPVGEQKDDWLRLFQAVALEDTSIWVPRLLREIEAAASEKSLRELARILRFDGSLIIFRFPQVTRAFLMRARMLGGDESYARICGDLYSACGPFVLSYHNGIPEEQSDYVEAEALRAAEAHASDEVLGQFYRRFVRNEQHQRVQAKSQQEADFAFLDAD